ncbi:Hypothetical predicted protein [Cloeon dipterum]|nr:Hypothetical predicted protein [Cloeon dipterum]
MAQHMKEFEKLPPAARDDVLQEILRQMRDDPERVQELAKGLHFLPNSMTQILDLTALTFQHLSYDYIDLCCVEEVLCAAVHRAPNLRQLFFGRGQMLEDFPNAANYAYISLVLNFRHLQILKMGLNVDLSDLVFLCGNLPSLRVLTIISVVNRINPFPGEDISNHLSNLRLLVINIVYKEESHDAKRIIQNHLPNLDIVCGFLTHTGLTFDDFLSHESQRKTFTCDSDWFENPDAEIHSRHPNVVHLTVVDIASTHAMKFLPSFPGIKSIKISGEVPTLYLGILEKYGHNLCRVYLHYRLIYAHSYQAIFNHCPRLEYLHMVTLSNRHDGPMANVSQLKEISLTHVCPWLSLLSAPLLKKVVLTGLRCDPGDDITRIASLIAENRILSQLEILHIDLDSIGLTSSWFKNLASMIQDASAFLPKLEDLKLYCDGLEYVTLVRRMQRDEYFKMQFFSDYVSVDGFDMRTPAEELEQEQVQEEELGQEQEPEQEQETEQEQEMEMEQEEELQQEELQQEQEQEEDINDVFIDQDLFDILLLYQKGI